MNVILINSNTTFISTKYPNTNFFDSGYLLAGSNENCCGAYYILIKFIETWFSKCTDIKSAILRLPLDNTEGDFCNPISGSIFSIISQFDEKTVTYNTKPSVSNVAINKFCKETEDQFLDIDITDAVRMYINNNSSDEITGIILKIENEDEIIKFKNSSNPDESLAPNIVLIDEKKCINKVEIVKVKTENKKFRGSVTTNKAASQTINVEGFDKYTYFINNEGEESCYVQIEVSGDGITWVKDSGPLQVLAGKAIDIVPMVYSKFSRLAYYTTQGSTNISIVFQAKV